MVAEPLPGLVHEDRVENVVVRQAVGADDLLDRMHGIGQEREGLVVAHRHLQLEPADRGSTDHDDRQRDVVALHPSETAAHAGLRRIHIALPPSSSLPGGSRARSSSVRSRPNATLARSTSYPAFMLRNACSRYCSAQYSPKDSAKPRGYSKGRYTSCTCTITPGASRGRTSSTTKFTSLPVLTVWVVSTRRTSPACNGSKRVEGRSWAAVRCSASSPGSSSETTDGYGS